MDITEYDEFYKWYKANERRFHCSQMTEVQIAYSAYLHGIEQSHKQGVVQGLPTEEDICAAGLKLTAHLTVEPMLRDMAKRYFRQGARWAISNMFGIQADLARSRGAKLKAFDWDKAAQLIKEKLKEHPDLSAEAGLQGDWGYTGGVIFENGKPTNDNYTYLSSNWAAPTLILSWDGEEQEEVECSIERNERFDSYTKWDKDSLAILGIEL